MARMQADDYKRTRNIQYACGGVGGGALRVVSGTGWV